MYLLRQIFFRLEKQQRRKQANRARKHEQHPEHTDQNGHVPFFHFGSPNKLNSFIRHEMKEKVRHGKHTQADNQGYPRKL